MTTYTLNFYGVTSAENYAKDIEADSLNHAAKLVKEMHLNGWMTLTLKVKGSSRSYRMSSLDGWYNSYWQ